jgi:hypothetical protein
MRSKPKQRPSVRRKPSGAKANKMPAQASLEPPPGFKDPRLGRGFDATAWPLCNGQLAPLPGSPDLYERRCLEFLVGYYQLNRLHQRLLEARVKSASKKKIRSLLAGIDKATAALEKLEDRYAPIGFFGEPVMDGVFYRDIVFVRPELPRIYPSMQSSHIAIPGLEEIPQSELRGPVKVIRLGRGKMDI